MTAPTPTAPTSTPAVLASGSTGWQSLPKGLWLLLGGIVALLWLRLEPSRGLAPPETGYWAGLLLLALYAIFNVQVAATFTWRHGMLAAVVFGLWVLFFWQVLVVAFDVPLVLLPPPSSIALALWEQAPVLRADFVQTVGKSVLGGWSLGCLLGFGVALAIDRLPFLERGLLPLASLTSAMPLVGIAPLTVMWFGHDWPSKVAVVVLMTFFPMLVSTRAGLAAAGRMERELMYSYAASYTHTLLALRLHCAVPFITSAMKVNASLALIGAIVAEFFTSPTVGLGFRIVTQSYRLNMPVVWSAIVVAAVTGSFMYALLVRLERRLAFWHPSVRHQS